jgi:hypothetical protein
MAATNCYEQGSGSLSIHSRTKENGIRILLFNINNIVFLMVSLVGLRTRSSPVCYSCYRCYQVRKARLVLSSLAPMEFC